MVFKVIKINLLSLFAIPLLLISTVVKLLSKALEKALLLLVVAGISLGVYALNEIVRDPNSFLYGLGIIVVMFIFFGLILAILFLVLVVFGGIAAVVVSTAVTIVTVVLEAVYEFSYRGYLKLFTICEQEYEYLQNEKGRKFAALCLFQHLLKVLSWTIVVVLSKARWGAIISAAGASVGIIVYFCRNAMETFGLAPIEYLRLFPTFEIFFSISYFLIIMGAFSVLIIALGEEWNEWGTQLRLATADAEVYQEAMLLATEKIGEIEPFSHSFEDGKISQRCEEHLQAFYEMIDGLSDLDQQVTDALQLNYDTMLKHDYVEYVGILNELVSSPSAVPENVFMQKYLPLIQRARRKNKDVQKGILRALKAASKHPKEGDTISFFDGCDTREKLKQRYKALCKVYHPDVGGDEATFKLLQNQYEAMLSDIK